MDAGGCVFVFVGMMEGGMCDAMRWDGMGVRRARRHARKPCVHGMSLYSVSPIRFVGGMQARWW